MLVIHRGIHIQSLLLPLAHWLKVQKNPWVQVYCFKSGRLSGNKKLDKQKYLTVFTTSSI